MGYWTWKSYKTYFDPVALFESLRGEEHLFFLDSSRPAPGLGAYSFIGASPFLTIGGRAVSALDSLGNRLDEFRLPRGPFPFMGGALGAFSYDFGVRLEPAIRRCLPDELSLPECWIGFYNTVFIFDHLRRRIVVAATGFPEKRGAAARLLARANLRSAERRLSSVQPSAGICPPGDCRLSSEETVSTVTRGRYVDMVRRAQAHIRAGNIYQVNLSQRFFRRCSSAGTDIYRRLRAVNPSAFGAYLDIGAVQLISSSPEEFLRKRGRELSTRPMKGTRLRSRDGRGDASRRRSLLSSPKEAAELMMIVDLMRNDLGRVCEYGSVVVPRLRELETYASVYQTTATVKGMVRSGCGPAEILRACFPGGSITGCPKVRAMQVIEELEPVRRGFYTGALGYAAFSGDMDFNMLIRTMVRHNGAVSFAAGSGIVADSDPFAEYEETLVKAAPMIKVMEGMP